MSNQAVKQASAASNERGVTLSSGRLHDRQIIKLADTFVEAGLGNFDDFSTLVNRFSEPKTFALIQSAIERGLAIGDPSNAFVESLLRHDVEKLSVALSRTQSVKDPNEFKVLWRFLSVELSEQRNIEELTLLVDSVAIVAKRFAEERGDYRVSPDLFHETGAILSFSQQPAFDLQLFLDTRQDAGFVYNKLREIYDKHPYIIDPRWVNSSKYTDEECDLFVKFASLATPVPLPTQEVVIRLLKSLPKPSHEELLGLFEHCMKDPAAQRGCTVLFQIMVADAQNASDYMILLADFKKCGGSELERTANLLKEIMAFDACHITELVNILKSRDFQKLEEFRYRVELRAERRKAPEKDLKEVRAAFLRKEHQDSEPPRAATLARAFDLYEKILKKSNEFLELDPEALKNKVKELRHWYGSEPHAIPHARWEEEYKVTFFALARNIFERRFGIYPYNTQMLSMLMLTDEQLLTEEGTKGVYAQIKTGEGKSLLFGILAAYYASRGEPADVITSNEYLAERDALKFNHFFQDFGLSSAAFKYGDRQPSDAQIIYTTSKDFIFELLGSRLDSRSFFGDKRFATALVDESDSLCIDEARQACRIGHMARGKFSDTELKHFIKFADRYPGITRKTLKYAAEMFLEDHPFGRRFGLAYIAAYVSSAGNSRYYQQGRDFVWNRVTEEGADGERSTYKLSPVDVDNTGRVQHSCHWNNGLHEMVMLRHNVSPGLESLSAAQMTHPAFLKRYNRLLCISGTMGDQIDRQMTRRAYRLSGFDVPSHHKSKRIDRTPEVVADKVRWLARIEEEVKSALKQKRAALVITQSINESTEVLEHLKKAGFYPQLLNDSQNSNTKGQSAPEEEIIALAGKPGMVTVATSVAGRGADIVPDKEVSDAGGVLSLTTFIPSNQRVEFQARGRAGRQGKPGESQIISCLESDPFLAYLPDVASGALQATIGEFGGQSQEVSLAIDFLRRVANYKTSVAREQSMKSDLIMEQALEGYFRRIDAFRIEWASEFTSAGLKGELANIKDYWVAKYDELRVKIEFYDSLNPRDPPPYSGRSDTNLGMMFNRNFVENRVGSKLAERFAAVLYDADRSLEILKASYSPEKQSALVQERDTLFTSLDDFMGRKIRWARYEKKRQEAERSMREAEAAAKVEASRKRQPVFIERNSSVAPDVHADSKLPPLRPNAGETFVLGATLQQFYLEQMSELGNAGGIGKVGYVTRYLAENLGPDCKISETELQYIKGAVLNYALANTPRMHAAVAEVIAREIRKGRGVS